ncbi:MAG: hypothetical protein DIZ80_02565 [endosymbiont of Galathealinum brachiosum]|uniref:SPOR domain-containing protein n=1 Tax=endosymbiont of Galathealinum brachiosum TaxID=2200906 RepID=A0A370DJW6_9GAMM|nr:MAG: hypothetical protein DIZ80_02565 [endosymbiont of Galathealinum brachiosum]
MRILLVFIVILNLLYAGWQYLSPVGVGGVILPMAEGLKVLELLDEGDVDEVKSIEESLQSVKDEKTDITADLQLDENIEQIKSEQVSCFTLGPFKDKSIMQQLRESIAEYVTDVSVRKRQESEKHRYWVYVPAMPDRKQAKLMAKKLRQKKINDFYIVLSGEAKNSISLGHFREPKHANRRMKKVADLGFKAEINVIYREYDIYWLDYQVKGKEEGGEFSVDEYISDGVSQLMRECDS